MSTFWINFFFKSLNEVMKTSEQDYATLDYIQLAYITMAHGSMCHTKVDEKKSLPRWVKRFTLVQRCFAKVDNFLSYILALNLVDYFRAL